MNRRQYKKYLKNETKDGQWQITSFHEGDYPKVSCKTLKFFGKSKKRVLGKTLNKPHNKIRRIGGYFTIPSFFSFKLLTVPVPNFIRNAANIKSKMPINSGTTVRMRRYDAGMVNE
jgi:hypothetical protein